MQFYALTVAALIVVCCASFANAAPPTVTAVVYSPDSKTLAAGTHRSVCMIDAKGDVTTRFEVEGPITALAYAPDGKSLAIATGKAGKSGEVILQPLPMGAPRRIAAHVDLIYGLSFNADGQQLATGSYDRLVKLWNVSTGQEIRTLKDHSDAVYAVAFQPGGTLLASVAADRAVKVWDTTTGKRLYSLTDPTDWLFALAWRPDGKALAAAGADKSVRVWEVDANEGRLKAAFFAHDGPVLRLVFTADGQKLYSIADDRSIKVWDWANKAELTAFPTLPANALAMALRPDGKQLAVARQDGLTLHDATNGNVTSMPLPVQPKITSIAPNAAPRGKSVRILATGIALDEVSEITSTMPGVTVRIVTDGRTPTTLPLDVTLAETLAPGRVPIMAKGSSPVEITVDLFNVGRAGLDSTYPAVLDRAGDIDTYQFALAEKQEVGAVVTLPTGGKLEPFLEWIGHDGRVLATGSTSVAFTAPANGAYALRIRDRDYRGGGEYGYRLHVGRVPVVSSVYPLGIQRGTKASVRLDGVFLSTKSLDVSVPADAAIGSRVPVPVSSAFGPSSVVIGEFPNGNDDNLSIPGTADGRIRKLGQHDSWKFTTKKGERLIVEVHARRLGSHLDSTIDILDQAGKPVEMARLRCVAKTVTVLRDIPADNAAIRLEAWNEFAMDDYVLMDQEVIRIADLPGHPDADCDFYQLGAKRVAYFGTTPSFHPMGGAVYKVQLHPPGTAFSPNGFPVVPLYYRNDDAVGKDSRLIFTAPADGTYTARVGDARGEGSEAHAYRLTIRPPKPDFNVRISTMTPSIAKGTATALAVTVNRVDEFDGPVTIALEGLPPGFTCPPAVVQAGRVSAVLGLAASIDAQVPPMGTAPTLVATGTVGGQLLNRQLKLGAPTIKDAGDIVTTVLQPNVPLKPGQETTIRVKIDRKNGFAGRVPLEVRGLPHGVRVLNIGLNGILITEKETTRTIPIFAEPWVAPMTVPIVVLAKREGTNTEHAAPPVPLKISH